MDAQSTGRAGDHSGRTGFKRVVSLVLTCAWLGLLGLAVAAPLMGAYTIGHSEPLEGAPSPWALFAPTLVALLFLIASSSLLFWRKRVDPIAVLLSMAYLATGASLHFADGIAGVVPFERLRLALEVIGIVCTTIAMLRFPDGMFRPRWARFALLPLLAWAFARAMDMLPGSTNALLSLGIMIASVMFVVLRYRMLPPGAERQQIRWALFGFAIGLTLNMLAVAMFARMATAPAEGDIEALWLTARVLNSLFLVSMASGLLVSILKYRLYDVDAVISRSAAYAGLTVVLVTIFAATEKLVEVIAQQWLKGSAGAVTAGVAAAVVAVLAAPLHSRAQGWAQRRFQRNLVHLRTSVPECAADLRETARLDELSAAVLHHILSDVRAQHGAVMVGCEVLAAEGIGTAGVDQWFKKTPLDAEDGTLSCDRSDALFPVRIPLKLSYAITDEPLGWVLLGPRPDGSFYGSDEREALRHVGGPIARALQVSAQRQREWQTLQRRWEALAERVLALESRRSRRRTNKLATAKS